MKRLAALPLLAIALAGCGGSGGSSPGAPTIQAARVYRLIHFTPAGAVVAGKPATVSFTIQQPSGATLT